MKIENLYIRKILTVTLALCMLISTGAYAEQEHIINAEARVFNPDVIYIQPGDTVKFVNMSSPSTGQAA